MVSWKKVPQSNHLAAPRATPILTIHLPQRLLTAPKV